MNKLLFGLYEVAKLFVQKASARVNNLNLPANIASAMRIGPPMIMNKKTGYIDVTIDLSKAPAARAYEYGSGVHATRGEKKPYKIPSDENVILGIPEERWPDFEFPVITGPKMLGYTGEKFILSEVSHPGVKAKPYISPTIEEISKEIRKILGRAAKAQILDGKAIYEEIIIK